MRLIAKLLVVIASTCFFVNAQKNYRIAPAFDLGGIEYFKEGFCFDIPYEYAALFLAPPVDGENGALSIAASGEKRYRMKINPDYRLPGGRKADAFSFLESWKKKSWWYKSYSSLIFGNVKGFSSVKSGSSYSIDGFIPVSRELLEIELVEPGPFFPAAFLDPFTGIQYFSPGEKRVVTGGDYLIDLSDEGIRLVSEVKSAMPEIILKEMNIDNKISSLKKGKIDAFELYNYDNLDYLRSSRKYDFTIKEFRKQNYFLALNRHSSGLHALFSESLDVYGLLPYKIFGNGTVGGNMDFPAAVSESASDGLLPEECSVIFQMSDTVSSIIADEIVSVLSEAGIDAAIYPLGYDDYYKALAQSEYTIAVAGISEAAFADRAFLRMFYNRYFADGGACVDPVNEGKKLIKSKRLFPLVTLIIYLVENTDGVGADKVFSNRN
ncbi:MAG: hypothetical protein ACLFQK_04865 [Fibrobacterota bacterium]